MFGSKKKEAGPVGATEKLAAAQRMREQGRYNNELAGANPEGNVRLQSQTVPVAIVFMLAVILAMIFTDDNAAIAGLHPTGIHALDNILTGSSISAFTGDRDMDRLITILIRGTFLFLAAGLVPLFAALAVRVTGRNRISPYTACWGMLIFLPALFYFGRDFLADIISDIARSI